MKRLPAPVLPDWLARMVPFERYRVDVGRYAMHVMEQGAGMPVVMLHGNPTWGFLYRKVFARLASAGVRAIAPDLVGLGFSDKPGAMEEHTVEQHARWFGTLLDELGLERFVLVCQDWGGPIGLRALADRADRVAGLVVLNTAIGPPRPDFRPTAFHRFARMPVVSDLVFRGLSFPQSTLWMAQGDRFSIRGDAARAYRYPLKGLANNVAPLALARMVPDSLGHPSVPALQRCLEFVEAFRGPAAIVWGDRDPILGRVRSFVERKLPRAHVTRTRAGHFLQEEVPDEIANAIRDVVAAAS
ncbi:MAG: alpha/beta fold hydrolase [Deltaproteobacteria bacterium]